MKYLVNMSRPLVYVETTIQSFYETTRTGVSALARRDWTRRWWEVARQRYALATSNAVLDELRDGEYPSREAALELVKDLPLLEITPAVGACQDSCRLSVHAAIG